MKAAWMEAIRLHMEPIPAKDAQRSGVYRLRDPYIGVSVVAKDSLRRRTPYLFATNRPADGADRIVHRCQQQGNSCFRKKPDLRGWRPTTKIQ